MWTAVGSRYTSVEPHHTATSRSQPCSSANRWMSEISASAWSIFDAAGLEVVAVEVAHVALLEHRRHRLDGAQLVAELLEHVLVEHAGTGRGDVGVVGVHVPAPEHEIVEVGERHVVA